MTEQSSSNPQVSSNPSQSSRRIVVIVLSILGAMLALCVCVVILFIFVFRSAPTVKARDAMIGTELGEDGRVLKDTRIIPANAKKIHLGFYFESPANVKATLNFRWYAEDQMIYSYSNVHEDSYVIANIELDPNQNGNLPAGNYHVEVWFGNTMILSEPFVVK